MTEGLCVGGPLHGEVVEWRPSPEHHVYERPGRADVYVRQSSSCLDEDEPVVLWRYRPLPFDAFLEAERELLLTPLARRLLGVKPGPFPNDLMILRD